MTMNKQFEPAPNGDPELTPEEQAEAQRRVAAIREDLRVERIVANCVANQTLEGLVCTEEDKAAVRRIATGETTAAEEVAKVLEPYKHEETVEEVCWEAWSDFLTAVEEGRGAEWLQLDPENDNDELPLFMLARFEEMRRKYNELQDKAQRQKERIEALTTDLHYLRKRVKELTEAAKP